MKKRDSGKYWIIPPVAMLIALCIVPLIMLLVFSFMDGNLVVGKGFPGWTLKNVTKLFSSTIFPKLMVKTLGIGALVTLICLAIGYPMAWAMAKLVKPRNRSMLMMLTILPFFTSQLLLIYAMMMILQSGGVLMTLLEWLHISPEQSILYTPAAVVIVLVYEYLPYMVLCLYSSLESIGDDLIQASHMLGAGAGKTFSNIVFPMSIPGLLSGILLVFVPVCGSFAESALVGGPNGMMIGSLINTQYSTVLNMGYGAALSCVFLIILSIIMLIVRRSVRRAEMRIGGENA